jgi:phosphoglycolate phosphatase
MPAHDAIFLDLDGCLVDSTRAITNTFDHALASVGIAPRAPEVTRSFIGPPLRATFDRIVAEEGRDPALAVELVMRYRERYRAMSAIETEIIAGVPQALAQLRNDAPIAIVTSKLGVVAERTRSDCARTSPSSTRRTTSMSSSRRRSRSAGRSQRPARGPTPR